MDGSEALAGLLLFLTGGRELDPSHQEELAIRLLKALRDGTSLDDAFGLAGSGKINFQKHILTARRDRHLWLALHYIDLDEKKPWPRCIKLSKEIKKFPIAWRRTKHLENPPESWPAWKQELWDAASTGLPLPTSPRAIMNLLNCKGGYSFQKLSKILASYYL